MNHPSKTYAVNGYPAFFLCIIPMLIGYFEIIKWIIEGITS